jgi:uncharacterized protein (DUF433 family)
MSHAEIVTIDPEIMSGMPVFSGTRVPVQNLLDYLKAGDSMTSGRSETIDGFPTVTRAQVIGFLDAAEAQIVKHMNLPLLICRQNGFAFGLEFADFGLPIGGVDLSI